jgi:hypothetical protein
VHGNEESRDKEGHKSELRDFGIESPHPGLGSGKVVVHMLGDFLKQRGRERERDRSRKTAGQGAIEKQKVDMNEGKFAAGQYAGSKGRLWGGGG